MKFPTAVAAVQEFYKQVMEREGTDRTFTADQLRAFVVDNVVGVVSPSSTDRVLRNLRAKGLVDYVVLNRSKSIYQARPLGTTHGA